MARDASPCDDLAAQFEHRFGSRPVMAWAPGRVNLIGDHVDYCGGRVLPMPIQFGTTVALARNGVGRLRAESLDVAPALDCDAASLPSLPPGHWARFVLGAIAVSGADGGWDVLVAGDIPGSGLSSSASLSVALLHALGRARGATLEGGALARAAQRVEHEFVGVTCGLMDQAVITLGVADAALLFDCATEQARSVPISPGAPSVLIFDTGKVRTLAASGYNARHAETVRVARALGVPLGSLAQMSLAAVDALEDPVLRRRGRHVVTEQGRVDAAVSMLERGDWCALGRLIAESHASLRDDFEVSCTELDLAVALLRESRNCCGARMTGGGFGGCVVALWRDSGDDTLDAVRNRYEARTGLTARLLFARSLGGVRAL
jgi:galactokinase